MASRPLSFLRSARVFLLPLGVAVATSVTSVARADAEMVPYEPASSEAIVSLSVEPTRSGDFAVLMLGARGSAFVSVRGPSGVVVPPTAISATSSTSALATVPARDRGDVHVALLGYGGELRSFVADLSGGAFREAEGTSRTSSYGNAGRLSMAYTDRPVVGVSTATKLALGDVFGPLATVERPSAAGPSVLGSVGGEAYVLTPASSGATVQHVAADGRSLDGATRVPSSGGTPSDVRLVPLGKGALAAFWPANRETSSVTIVPLTVSSSAALEPAAGSRMLPAGAVGLVADPDAPLGPDAKILRLEGGRLTEASWNAEAKAGASEATNTVASATGVGAVEGACSAKGCLYAFADDLGVRTVYTPREGAATEVRLSMPVTGGRTGGGSELSYSGCSQAPGGSRSSTVAGALGLGLAFAAARRRRTASR